ncbi:MAG: DUF1636 domain-containing protein [Candidatus Competibacterales bacterium]
MRPDPFRPAVVVCETCGYDPNRPEAERPGRRLFRVLEERVAAGVIEDPQAFDLVTTRCLMACKRPCNVHLRAPDKMLYVVGDLPWDATGADIVLDYFAKYLQSADGVVPYRQWPEGIKGRFVARIPPVFTAVPDNSADDP